MGSEGAAVVAHHLHHSLIGLPSSEDPDSYANIEKAHGVASLCQPSTRHASVPTPAMTPESSITPPPSIAPPPGMTRPDDLSHEPQLVVLCKVSLDAILPQAIGQNPHGNRQIVPVTGGSFDGPHLKGKVLSGGDWVLERLDGVRELDGRVTWQTDDGTLLYVTYRGYRVKISPVLPRWLAGEQSTSEEYYHMATLQFETSAAQYAWLEQVVIIGKGSLVQGGVSYDLFAVRYAEAANIQA